MSSRWLAAAVGGLAAFSLGQRALAAPQAAPPSACRMQLAAELPVTFDNNEPLVDARINGKPVRVLFDTGASRSSLMRSAARTLGMTPLGQEDAKAYGVGGFSAVAQTRLRDLDLAGVHFANFSVPVVGERMASIDMLMGRDFMGRVDIELDLGHSKIRLLKPKNCKSDQMVYWAPSYSQAPLQEPYLGGPFLIDVKLNGRVVRAMLDSGAQVSIAGPEAAARAGVVVESTGGKAGGIGSSLLSEGVATLDSFSVGDETIRRTKLRVADLFKGVEGMAAGSHISQKFEDLPGMLLGADFLRSHRVLISSSQGMVYFTYEGGAVFDTAHPPSERSAAAGQAAASRSPAGS